MRATIISIRITSTNRNMSQTPDLAALFVQKLAAYDKQTVQMKPCFTVCDQRHEGRAVIVGVVHGLCLFYRCSECGEEWLACFQCDRQRNKIKCRKSFWSHKSKVHADNIDLKRSAPPATQEDSHELLCRPTKSPRASGVDEDTMSSDERVDVELDDAYDTKSSSSQCFTDGSLNPPSVDVSTDQMCNGGTSDLELSDRDDEAVQIASYDTQASVGLTG